MWWWKNTAISLNRRYATAPAETVVSAAVERYGSRAVVTTSFGIQSAVMLHIAATVAPRIPVIWIDTGYLPPETYRYADELAGHLNLNLHVYQSRLSPARMEAIYGRLWEDPDPAALDRYHQIRKVEPLHRALRELRGKAWIAGVRSAQTDLRRSFKRVQRHGRLIKFHPILTWTDDEIAAYIDLHRLPQHPLATQGYATVGDAHLSGPLPAAAPSAHPGVAADAVPVASAAGAPGVSGREDTAPGGAPAPADIRATRFGGRKQECGIHLAAPDEHRSPLPSLFKRWGGEGGA